MAKKNGTTIRITPTSKKELFRLAAELSQIENRVVSMGEVISRILKAQDVKQRLKQGSMVRRMR